MADFTIYIGNKNYSSWSFRAWLMAKLSGAEFEEVLIPLQQAETHTEIMRHSPSGRLPLLQHGKTIVWESLAIGEYLAELFPKAGLWPEDKRARAMARAVSAEMHAGFLALRRHLPMNMRASYPSRGVSPEAQADLTRIAALWRDCRKLGGGKGKFLFGDFGIADAMYASVVSRIRTYEVEIDRETKAYVDAVVSFPAYQEWLDAAHQEPMIVAEWEF
jgi:glutathione S-transferase